MVAEAETRRRRAPELEVQPTWQKVLYLKQPFEDNYVDDSFLDSLALNANVQRYKFPSLLEGAARVVQQLSLVSIFLSVWSLVQVGAWNHDKLLALDGSLLIAGYALGIMIGRWQALGNRAGIVEEVVTDVLHGIRVLAPLWVMAPMLKTLTRSWSDDTIATLTFVLLTVHVSRHEYGKANSGVGAASAVPGGAVAINAAMLAATILASRLESVDQVFAFMSFAMEVFAFLPRLSARLRQQAPKGHAIAVTPLLASVAAALLGSPGAGRLLLSALGAVGFLGPALLVWVQRYKAEIRGPWDIAHVVESTSPADE